mgnify:CR=1 FL=1
MSAGIGWALWQHSKFYLQQFKEPVPGWMKGIETPKRLRLIKLASAWVGACPRSCYRTMRPKPGAPKPKGPEGRADPPNGLGGFDPDCRPRRFVKAAKEE